MLPLRVTDPLRPIGAIDPNKIDLSGRIQGLSSTFTFPSRRLYPGTWCDIGLSLLKPLTLEDVIVSVECPGNPNDHTCLISVARDVRSHSPYRLLVGPRPGVYALVARHRTTGAQIARTSFRIDPTLPLGDDGPSYWLRPTDGPPGTSIGGGPEGVENVAAIRNMRGLTWKIAVVLLEYSDATFPAEQVERQKIVDRWTAMLLTGTPFQGGNAAVKTFFEESSFGQTKIEGKVLGFTTVAGAFPDYFNLGDVFLVSGQNGAPDKQYQSAGPSDFQALVSAIDGKIDLSDYNSVFFVSPNHQPAGQTYERFSWPTATLGTSNFKVSQTKPDGSIVSVDKTIGAFVMPNSFDMVRTTMTTICHELGHNFGMSDQYAPGVQGDVAGTFRNVDKWDPMDHEDFLSHHCLYHKLALGWAVDKGASLPDRDKIVRSIDFSKAGQGAETLKIAPLELPCPPGLHHGVEVRISEGHNYYFEYRRQNAGATVGDRVLPETPVVLGTDTVRDPNNSLAARPQVLLLSADPDGDSAVLSKGEDYEQTNIKAGDVPMTLRVEVLDTQPTFAEIKVTYTVQAAPNPSIKPWHTVPDRWWQSPDIEIRNERTIANPTLYANKLWLGQPNTIVAHVTNTGGADAPGVIVTFAVKDFTVAGGAETPIGQDKKDVAVGASAEFTTVFTPPAGAADDAHYCVVARVQPYLTPVSKTLETDVYDNIAQSNYAGLTSVMASPPTRPLTQVTLSNPFDAPARVYVQPAQSHGGFISYLAHRWLRLPAHATTKVAVATEYAPEPARAMQVSTHFEQPVVSPERLFGARARLSLSAWVEAPEDFHPRRLDGADLDLQAAFQTTVVRLAGSHRSETVNGHVFRVGGSQHGPVAGGAVLLVLAPHTRQRAVLSSTVTQGRFEFSKVTAPVGTLFELYYLGEKGNAACSATGVIEA